MPRTAPIGSVSERIEIATALYGNEILIKNEGNDLDTYLRIWKPHASNLGHAIDDKWMKDCYDSSRDDDDTKVVRILNHQIPCPSSYNSRTYRNFQLKNK